MEKPKTIHDFYGFPQALFDVQYPGAGRPETRIQGARPAFAGGGAAADQSWELDHGAALTRFLKHAYPECGHPRRPAELDGAQPPQFH